MPVTQRDIDALREIIAQLREDLRDHRAGNVREFEQVWRHIEGLNERVSSNAERISSLEAKLESNSAQGFWEVIRSIFFGRK